MGALVHRVLRIAHCHPAPSPIAHPLAGADPTHRLTTDGGPTGMTRAQYLPARSAKSCSQSPYRVYFPPSRIRAPRWIAGSEGTGRSLLVTPPPPPPISPCSTRLRRRVEAEPEPFSPILRTTAYWGAGREGKGMMPVPGGAAVAVDHATDGCLNPIADPPPPRPGKLDTQVQFAFTAHGSSVSPTRADEPLPAFKPSPSRTAAATRGGAAMAAAALLAEVGPRPPPSQNFGGDPPTSYRVPSQPRATRGLGTRTRGRRRRCSAGGLCRRR